MAASSPSRDHLPTPFRCPSRSRWAHRMPRLLLGVRPESPRGVGIPWEDPAEAGGKFDVTIVTPPGPQPGDTVTLRVRASACPRTNWEVLRTTRKPLPGCYVGEHCGPIPADASPLPGPVPRISSPPGGRVAGWAPRPAVRSGVHMPAPLRLVRSGVLPAVGRRWLRPVPPAVVVDGPPPFLAVPPLDEEDPGCKGACALCGVVKLQGRGLPWSGASGWLA